SSLALRFQTDVAPFAALPDEVGPHAWNALADLVGPGGGAVIFRPSVVTPPPDWQITTTINSLQMVATEPIGEPDDAFVGLHAGDVDDMLALVERTKPGPFFRRTVELGTYLGHRRTPDGRLIAMTGERVHPAGYTELSAVCTDADARKTGLATRLVRAVAAGIEARGETPILHVVAENHAAIRVYEALGFSTRAAFEAFIVQAPR
ncbi:MAG TPA: GNAT family N-acetyltransferase, partial [Acidimicrobiia bacterium]|nr:GNAT family N-acetyltransferase [Acidimicrobiia bacterium]